MQFVLRPIELVVLQGTSFCNLNCTYCDLSPSSRRTKGAMDLALVERLFSELFQTRRLATTATVIWHSGEPLTLPPPYYDDAIALIFGLQDRFDAHDVALRFGIQTNAVLIDDEWCDFFLRHKDRLDLGVSCDGPAELHDAFRVGWNTRGSHAHTVRGMDLLQQRGIKFKVIAVATRKALERPDSFYRFFFERRLQLSGFHFNLVAESNAEDSDLAYCASDRPTYYAFYRRLLELDRLAGKGDFRILNFELARDRIAASGGPVPGFFDEASAPLKSLNVDARGNVTTFHAGLGVDVLPDAYGDSQGLSLGNILQTPLEAMLVSEKLERMVADFLASRRACEASCEYFNVCPGGYELLKRKALGTYDASETTECLIQVKTLVDAVLDDIDAQSSTAVVAP